MIVTFCNGKGGSGKTTLSVLLAFALKEAGHHVAILDTDPQKTATRIIQEVGGVDVVDTPGDHTVTIIDTPGRLAETQTMMSLKRADAVILVSQPSPADLFTTKDTAALIESEGLSGKARILFNQVERGTVLAKALADMEGRIGLPALVNRIHRRQAYQHAMILGWKSLGADARQEILTVALEIVASKPTMNVSSEYRIAG